MKRRIFGLLAGTSVAALKFGFARAQSAPDPTLLTTTLTPLGSERAGNADGSIPAWTGGFQTLPAGWQPGQSMPDFFAAEQPVLEIDSSNMADHMDRLSDGVVAMMQKYGYKIKVYPTHRTASAPQWVYDNIAANAVNAKLEPSGGQLGFSGAYGGIPFPIPDTSNPLAAGAQLIWNHCCRWQGQAISGHSYGYVVSGGSVIISDESNTNDIFPYYQKGGSAQAFDGWLELIDDSAFLQPSNLVGEQAVEWFSTNPLRQPTQAWELLQGQGRVRKEPELQYDTPSSFADGQANYDEYYGFLGAPDQYDWTYATKKEMYVPYNNNAMFLPPGPEVMGPHFPDPNVVRWELHRVWVVDATLHAGKRNVLAHRRFYFDEDASMACIVDAWDANQKLYHVQICYNNLRPDLPGVVNDQTSVHNLQTDDYTMPAGLFNELAHPTRRFYDTLAASMFDPNNMAASAQY